MAKKKNVGIARTKEPIADDDTYMIVETPSTNSLRVKVNHFKKEGWEPLGGPIFDGISWYQAMEWPTEEDPFE